MSAKQDGRYNHGYIRVAMSWAQGEPAADCWSSLLKLKPSLGAAYLVVGLLHGRTLDSKSGPFFFHARYTRPLRNRHETPCRECIQYRRASIFEVPTRSFSLGVLPDSSRTLWRGGTAFDQPTADALSCGTCVCVCFQCRSRVDDTVTGAQKPFTGVLRNGRPYFHRTPERELSIRVRSASSRASQSNNGALLS